MTDGPTTRIALMADPETHSVVLAFIDPEREIHLTLTPDEAKYIAVLLLNTAHEVAGSEEPPTVTH